MNERELATERLIAKVLPYLAQAIEANTPADRSFVLVVFGHQERPWEKLGHWIHSPGIDSESIAKVLEECASKIRGDGRGNRTGLRPEDVN